MRGIARSEWLPLLLLLTAAGLGLALRLLADAIDATRQTADARQHSRIPPRFGSRRCITHPGEQVVGVMTAHPAWPQSEYDQNRAGLSPVCRARPS